MASLIREFDSESPNFLTCRQTCPFPETPTDFEERKSKQQLAGNSRNTVCCLARFEKIRMTQQQVARIEFSMPCEIATSLVWIVFSAESLSFSFLTKNWSFLELRVEISNLADLFSIRLRKSLRFATRCAFHLFS